MILARFHSTFTIPLFASLTECVKGFDDTTYSAVTGLAYDATSKKLGLKVGADTVIPFSGGLAVKEIISARYGSGYRLMVINDTGYHNNYSTPLSAGTALNSYLESVDASVTNISGSYWGTGVTRKAGYYLPIGNGTDFSITYYNAGASINLGGMSSSYPATLLYFGETNPFN